MSASINMLTSNSAESGRRQFSECSKDIRNGRRHVSQAIAPGHHDQHSGRESGKILLELDTFVGGEEKIEFRCGEREQLAILDTSLPTALH